MKTELGVAYSSEHQDARRLDLFLPDAANGGAILFIHGGGWSGGRREQWHACAAHLAALGYACASAGYRLAPATRFPGQVEDVRLAMAWMRSHADARGFRSDRIAAAGSSAGGHLVAMLATIAPGDALGATPELNPRDTRPDAAVCYCPVLDLRGRLSETVEAFLGAREADAPALYRAASPLDRVTGREPPFLFLHGDADEVAPLAQSVAMHDKLRANGVASELVVLRGVGHGFGYGVATDPQKHSLAHIERFLSEHFPRG